MSDFQIYLLYFLLIAVSAAALCLGVVARITCKP